MRSITVNRNAPATRGLAELNHHNREELKQVRNGTALNGQWLSEEDETKINEDVNSGRQFELIQPHDALHRQHQPHQPHQGSMVEWERFLPLRSLKVLLVENDDSTRHIVSALLRNCSYEVTAVANGIEAWKVLIDLNKQIDIVLTEVLMPYLSGIGLLTKIMNHVPRKNVPVIMMSSDDSMGIVFNCLSKGAVDFLVKPIRKNELKNLWQHVWRKCHSQSSGSGSESGIGTRKSAKSITNKESDDDDDVDDDDSDTSDEDDAVSMDMNAKDGSDNGSGTQSSWSKKPVEINSSQAKSVWDKLPNPVTARKEHVTQEDKLETVEMGKDLEIGVPNSSSSFQVEDPKKKSTSKFCESNLKKMGDSLDISMQIGGENDSQGTQKTTNVQNEALPKAKNIINIEDNNNINNNNKSIYYSKQSPALELTLKRPRDAEDAGDQDRNLLSHSGVSAFSRYNTVSNLNQAPTGIVGSCSPLGNSSEAANADKSNSNGNPNQNGSDDMGSTTNNAFATKPDDKSVPNGSTIAVHHTSTIQIQPLEPCTDGGDMGSGKQVQVRHHHHHYHHHHHHVHKQNLLTASAEGNAANFGSASGSNNKSNGEKSGSWQIEKVSAPVTDVVKIGSDNGVAGKLNGGDGSGSGSGSGVDQDRLAQREAALNKFRQKRKERCFEKKVRYHSRKKLAEQRPRVRGQFVRHSGANGVNNEDADS